MINLKQNIVVNLKRDRGMVANYELFARGLKHRQNCRQLKKILSIRTELEVFNSFITFDGGIGLQLSGILAGFYPRWHRFSAT